MSKTKSEISARIKEIITEKLGLTEGEIKDDSHLADFGADSLDCFELEIDIEEEYHVKFETHDILVDQEVSSITDYVIGALREKGEIIL